MNEFVLGNLCSANIDRTHSSLGVTPNGVLMGFAPILPIPLAVVGAVTSKITKPQQELLEYHDPSEYIYSLQN